MPEKHIIAMAKERPPEEILQNVSFQVSSHGLSVYPPRTSFGPRILPNYEFVWIIEGDVVFECDGVPHDAPTGTVILTRPGMHDAYLWDRKRQTRHGFFHFLIHANSGGTLPVTNNWPLLRHLSGDNIIHPLFHHLSWLITAEPPGWEALVQGAMRQALTAFVTGSCSAAPEESGSHHPAIDRAMTYVHKQWAGERLVPVSLGELAAAAQVSRAHLTRLFREDFKLTPIEAMRYLRLDRAASLLSRTDLTVGDIAERCGFESQFHFSRLFTQTFHYSPRSFRQRIAAGMDMPIVRLAQGKRLSARIWADG